MIIFNRVLFLLQEEVTIGMTDNDLKESRVVLRAVQEHLSYSHHTLGAITEKVGW